VESSSTTKTVEFASAIAAAHGAVKASFFRFTGRCAFGVSYSQAVDMNSPLRRHRTI
jgi:hypothetical protein